MCTNYRPTRHDRMVLQRSLLPPPFDHPPQAFPGYLAPVLVSGADDVEWRQAMFGLVPSWAKDVAISRHTYNARSETIGEKPSYRGPWARRQFCIAPASCFFEPNYESGRPVRWRIERTDGRDFGIVGVWDTWETRGADGKRDGGILASFSLVTINADHHPLMRRFHAPGDEKRSLVVLPEDRWDDWLRCPSEDAARTLLTDLPAAEFRAEADPLVRRRRPPMEPVPVTADLF